MKKIIIAVVMVLLGLAALYFLTSRPVKLTGECAKTETASVPQSHRSYKLAVCSDMKNMQPGKKTNITFMVRNDQEKTVKNFAVVHDKIMHFIVIRKDLQHFQHLHPTFDKNSGVFSVDVTFPTDGPYRMYPDFMPDKNEDNPQQLSVTLDRDVQMGDMGKYKAVVNKPDNESAHVVGDYVVNFTLPSVFELKTDADIMYGISVRKDQKPVMDLEPYLGALGHSVIIKEGNLSFIHTHALEGGGVSVANEKMEHNLGQMEGNSMAASRAPTDNNNNPQMSFATLFQEPGIYKIFVQFQHQGRVVTADRMIEVK